MVLLWYCSVVDWIVRSLGGGKFTIILCMALASSIIFSTPVYAAGENEKNDVVNIVNEHADSILFDDLLSHKKITTGDDFVTLDELSERFDVNAVSDDIMTLALGGDQYQSNNTSSTATRGLMGTKITATIHEESDWDFYRLSVTDTSQPYSFILMNIPSGCDYDMYLLNSDLTGGYVNIQEGNTPEEMYLNINEQGTYYVVIQSHSGCSDSPYTLYFGPAYKTGDTGWRDSGLKFNFGYIPQGNDYYTSVSPQNYDLTYDSSIPNGSVMTALKMDLNGNGGKWGGFTKYIREPSGYGMKQYGNLPDFDVPDMTYFVKQNWQIWGEVLYSNSFIWEPNIFITYKFIVTPQTMGYVR